MEKDVKDYLMTNESGIGLYVGTYRKYSEGRIYGAWIDLESVCDADEFFSVFRQLHSDEKSPEFMFQDFQGFPEELYHESMGKKEIQKILNYVALDDDDKRLVEDYCEVYCGSIEDFEDFVETAKDRCMGQFDSFRDFADEMADEEIACHSLGNSTEFFEKYFDYNKWETYLTYDYKMGGNGYVFSTCY